MVIPTEHFRSDYSEIPLRIAKGHFATSHSHINYFIDMTFTKHRLAEARQAAKELAVKYHSSEYVDTILCLDGTEVLGACLAEELISEGIKTAGQNRLRFIAQRTLPQVFALLESALFRVGCNLVFLLFGDVEIDSFFL